MKVQPQSPFGFWGDWNIEKEGKIYYNVHYLVTIAFRLLG